MYIALKDLEIRGAGNLLGGEQSGHIAGGRLRPVRADDRRGGPRAARGRARPSGAEVRVELPVDAHIPHDYVTGERLRLEAYTRIAAIDSDDDIVAVREELTDRYGPLPSQVQSLLAVARLRPGPPGRADRHHPAGQPHPVLAGASCPTPGRSGCSGCTRGRCSSRQCVRCSYRCRRPCPARARVGQHAAAPGRPCLWRSADSCAELLAWCEQLIETVLGDAGRALGIRRNIVVRRTSMQLAAAVLAGGLAVTACGTLQLGAAAVTGQGRITSAGADQPGGQPQRGLPGGQGQGRQPQAPGSRSRSRC